MDTIGKRVAWRRQVLGLSQAGLAKRCGVPAQSIQQLEAGQVERPRYLLELAQALHTTPQWLLYGTEPEEPEPVAPAAQRQPDVPVLGVVEGGEGADFTFVGTSYEMVLRPPVLDKVSNAYALYMTGESMEPRYLPGEIVYVNPNRPVTNGSFVVIQLRDGRGLIKRLRRRNSERLVLEQYNPAKVFEIAAADVASVHLVVQSGMR